MTITLCKGDRKAAMEKVIYVKATKTNSFLVQIFLKIVKKLTMIKQKL